MALEDNKLVNKTKYLQTLRVDKVDEMDIYISRKLFPR